MGDGQQENLIISILDKGVVDCDASNSISSVTATSLLPNACEFVESLGLFRLTRARGKALASGGFGIVLSALEESDLISKNNIHSIESKSTNDNNEKCKQVTHEENVADDVLNNFLHAEIEKSVALTKNVFEDGVNVNAELHLDSTTVHHNLRIFESVQIGGESNAMENEKILDTQKERIQPTEYLFIEEVLVLFEKGLIEVCPDSKKRSQHGICQTAERLSSWHLYNLLEPLGVPLPVYLVYAHLRQQTYRVLRHSPSRGAILDEIETVMQELELEHSRKSADDKNQGFSFDRNNLMKRNAKLRTLRLSLRHAATNAGPPTMMAPFSIQSNDTTGQLQPTFQLQPAFDVYRPNGTFARSDPGRPDFHVAVTSYQHSFVSFLNIQKLLLESCRGVPLKIATVSDAGTVVMFGVTNFGVPIVTSAISNA